MRDAWIIFDADNTLWSVEHLYDEARAELARCLSSRGHSPELVQAYQMSRDSTLFAELGYSTARFPESFVQTLKHFDPDAGESDERHLRALAARVFAMQAPLFSDAREALVSLSADFHLGLMTAGDQDVQRRRISQSGLASLFDAITIVPLKSRRTFEEFCRDHCVDIPASWSIGDSLRADIFPARQIGLNAIWVRNHNWLAVEGSHEDPDEHVGVVRDLKAAVDMVRQRESRIAVSS